MLKVHHLDFSRSHRVLWLLEELGLPYELVTYQRDPKTIFAPPELRAVHPLGKSPILEDNGRLLPESGAILEHLLDHHGNGRFAPAKGSPNRDDYLYWMHAAEGSAMTPLLIKLYMDRIGPASEPMMPRVNQLIADQLGYMEQTLRQRDYFAGEFSAADIQMIYPVEFAFAGAKRDGGAMQGIEGWRKRVSARPAYQRALERGGPIMMEKPPAQDRRQTAEQVKS